MLAGAVVTLLWVADLHQPALAEEATSPGAAPSPAALLDSHCAKCHNVSDWAGGLAFELLDAHHVGDDAEAWEKAVRKLRARLMPPAGEEQPAQTDVDALVNYLETSLDGAAKNRIGHVPIQRLSRYEFAASVKGLLGVEIDPRQAMGKDAAILGMTLFNASEADLVSIHAALGAGLANGSLNPVIGREIPLADAPAAHTALLEPGALGKIVLIP